MILTLVSVLLVLEASDTPGRRGAIALFGAWLAIAVSILIKPPAVVIVPLLVAFILATPERSERALRALATLAGVIGAFALAYCASLPFHPGLNPLTQFEWLYSRYAYASNVYPFSSVNAFNLYAMLHNFWESDAQTLPNWTIGSVTLALPQYEWGILLMLALVALADHGLPAAARRQDGSGLSRRRDDPLAGLFRLLDAHARALHLRRLRAGDSARLACARRYLYAAILISLTLLANLLLFALLPVRRWTPRRRVSTRPT